VRPGGRSGRRESYGAECGPFPPARRSMSRSAPSAMGQPRSAMWACGAGRGRSTGASRQSGLFTAVLVAAAPATFQIWAGPRTLFTFKAVTGPVSLASACEPTAQFTDAAGASSTLCWRGRTSARAAAERFRVGVATALVWARRARERASGAPATLDRVLPCVPFDAARMGVRGSGPHHWDALEPLPARPVLLARGATRARAPRPRRSRRPGD
jgi:hypothetical protein